MMRLRCNCEDFCGRPIARRAGGKTSVPALCEYGKWRITDVASNSLKHDLGRRIFTAHLLHLKSDEEQAIMESPMNKSPKTEPILAGEKATIENTQSSALSVSLFSNDGSEFEIEMMPGQIVGVSAGSADIQVVLHKGDPAGLLIIRPQSAS